MSAPGPGAGEESGLGRWGRGASEHPSPPHKSTSSHFIPGAAGRRHPTLSTRQDPRAHLQKTHPLSPAQPGGGGTTEPLAPSSHSLNFPLCVCLSLKSLPSPDILLITAPRDSYGKQLPYQGSPEVQPLPSHILQPLQTYRGALVTPHLGYKGRTGGLRP